MRATFDEMPEVMSKRELSATTGLSISTIQRLENRGEGPPRIRLSPHRVAYRRTAVMAWLESLAEQVTTEAS